MAFDGTLKFDTAIDKTGFKLGISDLGSLAKKGMAVVTGAVAAASAGVTALGVYASDVGKKFESSMAQVIATMGITKDTIQDGVNSYDLLKKAAAAAGESTTFSASEAADALNFLALAGYDAAKAADALPSVLNLAAAGGMDLAYASDLATDAMAALGIEATSINLTRFGDEMAKTASKANTSVSQLGEAILTVGGTAKSLAGGTTELNAALGVLANRGIKGSEGGTALRNVILALSAPTDKAAAALEGLGVKAFDSEGKLRPLNETFADLNNALAEMNEGEKTQVLNAIFNKVDLKSAQALLAGCGEEFDNLTMALEGCDGAMADMAHTMNDTLEGDIKSLQSKAEAFGIAIYENMDAPLRELVQLGGESISQLTNAFKEGGFDGLAESLGGVLADAVTTLSGYIPKMVDVAVSLVQSLIKGLSKNADSITKAGLNAVKSLISGILSSAVSLVELGKVMMSALLDGISEMVSSGGVSEMLDAALDLIMSFSQALIDLAPQLFSAAAKLVETLAEFLVKALPVLIPQLFKLVYGIVEALTSSELLGTLIKAAIPIITALADGLFAAAPIVYELLPKIIEQLIETIIDCAPELWEAGKELLIHLKDGIIEVFPQLLNAWGKLFNAEKFAAVGKDIVTGIMEWLNTLPERISETLGNALATIAKWAVDAPSKAKEAATTLYNNVVEWVKKLPGDIKKFLDDTLPKIVEWGTSLAAKGLAAAKELFDSIVNKAAEIPGKMLEIGKDIVTSLMEWLDTLPERIGEMLGKALSTIAKWAIDAPQKAKEAAINLYNNVVEWVKKLPGEIKKFLDDTLPKIVDWGRNLAAKGRSAAKELFDSVVNKVGEIPGKMFEIGSNIVSGIWNGISSAKDWLANQISGFAGGVLSGIKDSFGIHSPSTVMRDQVGKYLAEGIGIGFTENMPDLAATAQRIINDLSFLDIPELQLTVSDIEIPEIDIPNPKVEVEIPDIVPPKTEILPTKLDIDVPNPIIDFPDIDFPNCPDDRKPPAPQIDISAYQALNSGISGINSNIAPSSTSEIVNNYSYSTTTNNNSTEVPPAQPIMFNVKLDLNGEDFAEGFVDIAADRIDEQQGVTVELKKRGLAR